jgi:protein-L-isoaspartate(D-aspartate) O-methyltransferase
MTEFALARRNMVDGQVRTADVTDLRIISAMLDLPRENFVPPQAASLAYLDLDLAVGDGRSRRLLKPMVLSKLIQALDIAPTDRVLDVGSAMGYGAALIHRLAGEVVALEEDAGLAQAAHVALSAMRNVTLADGPLSAGWVQGAPYDAILLEGATEVGPEAICRQLKDGGRLVCVLGSGPGAKAMLYVRSGDEFGGRPLFDAAAAVLPGFTKPPAFVF